MDFFSFFLFLSFLATCQHRARLEREVTPKIINHWGDVWIVVNSVTSNENVVLLQMMAFV